MPENCPPNKTNIALTGRNGRMGRMVYCAATQHQAFKVSCLTSSWALSKFILTAANIRLFLEDEIIIIDAACAVDFSKPRGTVYYTKLFIQHKVNMVVGTTGFSPREEAFLNGAGRFIGILISPNTSLGVNKFISLASIAATFFKRTYDGTVLELHHKRKTDSPSGTAIQLKRVIESNWSGKMGCWAPGLKLQRINQPKLNLCSVRSGNVVGEHLVIFMSNNERIVIKHCSSNRAHYAKGALLAANWVAKARKGIFSMSDIIDGTL